MAQQSGTTATLSPNGLGATSGIASRNSAMVIIDRQPPYGVAQDAPLTFFSYEEAVALGIDGNRDATEENMVAWHIKQYFQRNANERLDVVFTTAGNAVTTLQGLRQYNKGIHRQIALINAPQDSEFTTAVAFWATEQLEVYKSPVLLLGYFYDQNETAHPEPNNALQFLVHLTSTNLSGMRHWLGLDADAVLPAGLENEPALGWLLGDVANTNVGDHIGHVGGAGNNLAANGIDWQDFGFADTGERYENESEGQLNTRKSLHQVYARRLPNVDGATWENDHTLAVGEAQSPQPSDLRFMHRIRPLMEAIRLGDSVAVQEVNRVIRLNADGTLPTDYIDDLTARIDFAMSALVKSDDLPSIQSVIDPKQDVLNTRRLVIGYNAGPNVALSFIYQIGQYTTA